MSCVLLLGPSCAGKSTLCTRAKRFGWRIVSADDVFDSLKIGHVGPWALLKPRVRPLLAQMVEDLLRKGEKVCVDDIATETFKRLAKFDPVVVLVMAPLEVLAARAQTRAVHRPLTSVWKSLRDLVEPCTHSNNRRVLHTTRAEIEALSGNKAPQSWVAEPSLCLCAKTSFPVHTLVNTHTKAVRGRPLDFLSGL